MNCVGVIPARYASTRLPAKVLREIDGKPMILHVLDRVKKSAELQDIIVACDDERVKTCVEEAGGHALMTREDHLNGSSRVAEIAEQADADIFINIQGDEPLISPIAIDELARAFKQDESLRVATLAVMSENEAELRDPNTVKVVCDRDSHALYFSRAEIPFHRDPETPVKFLKHLGIYGYRKEFLLDFVTWRPTRLETVEKLEQLRILERGVQIKIVETGFDSPSVDTEEDLKRVEALMKKK